MKKVLQGPIFICFEGVAGSGKTTQVALLKKKLEKKNWGEVIITKTYEGEIKKAATRFIRALNLDPRSISMMFLFQALHAEQYKKTKEALSSGKIVIADRWNESFLAYHLNFPPLSQKPKEMLEILDELAFQALEPQITFLLDVPEKTALQRISSRSPKDMLPKIGTKKFFVPIEPENFFTIQRKYYLKVARKKNWVVISANNRSIENIHNFIWKTLLSKLEELEDEIPNSFLFLILIKNA